VEGSANDILLLVRCQANKIDVVALAGHAQMRHFSKHRLHAVQNRRAATFMDLYLGIGQDTLGSAPRCHL